jgi:hypothetical protein
MHLVIPVCVPALPLQWPAARLCFFDLRTRQRRARGAMLMSSPPLLLLLPPPRR